MTRIHVSIGSNVDRAKNLRSAHAALTGKFSNLVVSPVYESKPIGFDGDNFYNAVAACDSPFSLPGTLAALSEIEIALGRVRTGERFGPRTMDLDLLTFGDAVITSENVAIPRDEITAYAFVLRPLSEIAPEDVHPRLRQTYRELWKNFDGRDQSLWQVAFDWTQR